MGTALAFFLFYEGSYLFFTYTHPRFRTFQIQAFEMQKTAWLRGFLPKYLFGFPRMRNNYGVDTIWPFFIQDVGDFLKTVSGKV